LWSGGIVEAGYRLLPARCFVLIGIVVGVIVSAINVCSVGRGLCLVISLLLVLSLLLGSCNVAASAFYDQPECTRLNKPDFDAASAFDTADMFRIQEARRDM
jgi:hypothetical protein